MSAESDDGVFTSMREQLDDIPTPTERSVRELSDVELASELGHVREELIERGEMLNVRTETGRELHSRRGALIIELHRRTQKEDTR